MNRYFKPQWLAALSLASLSACVGGGSSSLNTMVDALDGMKGNSSPVVDAYIQYPGPDSRWAGPVLWTVHVSAREGQGPVFEVVPALPKVKEGSVGAPELSGRMPASALGLTQGKTTVPVAGAQGAGFVRLTQEQVRDRLQHLGAAVSGAEDETSACVTVVKVRLARADGSVTEKQACRGNAIWTQVASELAAEFMVQSRYPASEAASPAAAPATESSKPAHGAGEHAEKHG